MSWLLYRLYCWTRRERDGWPDSRNIFYRAYIRWQASRYEP